MSDTTEGGAKNVASKTSQHDHDGPALSDEGLALDLDLQRKVKTALRLASQALGNGDMAELELFGIEIAHLAGLIYAGRYATPKSPAKNPQKPSAKTETQLLTGGTAPKFSPASDATVGLLEVEPCNSKIGGKS
jgi:hypothetical protein